MASLCAAGSMTCKMAALRPQAAARGRLAAASAAAPLRASPAQAGFRPALTGGNVHQRNCFMGGAAVAARPAAGTARSRRQVAVAASWGRGSSGPEIPERIVAALPYLMPVLDGVRYGKFFLVQFPQFGALLLPIEPLIRLYFTVPFASIVVFFGIYLGIINNPSFSRYVRFNAMQAVLLDIILILPGLLESVFRPPIGGPGLQLYISLYNTIFLFLMASVAYGIGSCLAGQTARLPLVADAADAQVR